MSYFAQTVAACFIALCCFELLKIVCSVLDEWLTRKTR